MNSIDKRIIDFIKQHHVLTLATTFKNETWCAQRVSMYLAKRNLFVFTSDMETKHIQDTMSQDIVAGSVVLETNIIGKIRGLQFQGKIFKPDIKLLKEMKIAYLKRFPVAMLMKTTLWAVEPNLLKYTDNRLGFGKRLVWKNKK